MNKEELILHAKEVILPFWSFAQDKEQGGFFAYLDQNAKVIDHMAKKGLVQHARLLWSFSFAYEKFQDPQQLFLARHAFAFLMEKFWDEEYAGFYYYVARDGSAIDDRKHMYPHSFVLYAMAQFYKATHDGEVLVWCKKVYELIMLHGRDHTHGGFHESFSRSWSRIDQIDEYGVGGHSKTMNSHIHLLEAMTLYAEINPTVDVICQLQHLIDIIVDKIFNPSDKTLHLYFDPNWKCHQARFSFGHDIETSWLLVKALKITDYRKEFVLQICDDLVAQVYQQGIAPQGHLYNEWDPETKHMDERIYWWMQVEGMVGFLYAAIRNDKKDYYKTVEDLWHFCLKNYWDGKSLEWNELPDNFKSAKSSVWKTPYHTLRALLECYMQL